MKEEINPYDSNLNNKKFYICNFIGISTSEGDDHSSQIGPYEIFFREEGLGILNLEGPFVTRDHPRSTVKNIEVDGLDITINLKDAEPVKLKFTKNIEVIQFTVLIEKYFERKFFVFDVNDFALKPSARKEDVFKNICRSLNKEMFLMKYETTFFISLYMVANNKLRHCSIININMDIHKSKGAHLAHLLPSYALKYEHVFLVRDCYDLPTTLNTASKNLLDIMLPKRYEIIVPQYYSGANVDNTKTGEQKITKKLVKCANLTGLTINTQRDQKLAPYLEAIKDLIYCAFYICHAIKRRKMPILLRETIRLRTNSLVVCLVKVILYREYRTMLGILQLIQTEWINYNYSFQNGEKCMLFELWLLSLKSVIEKSQDYFEYNTHLMDDMILYCQNREHFPFFEEEKSINLLNVLSSVKTYKQERTPDEDLFNHLRSLFGLKTIHIFPLVTPDNITVKESIFMPEKYIYEPK